MGRHYDAFLSSPNSSMESISQIARSPSSMYSGPDERDSLERSAEGLCDFIKRLERALPLHLADPNIVTYMINEANSRHADAMDACVKLEDISIGGDCLPTWPGMTWDATKLSAHDAIQERLMAYEASLALGSLLRRDILAKGTERLREAVELGLTTEHVHWGYDMLPTWAGRAPELQNFDLDDIMALQDEDDSGEDSCSSASLDSDMADSPYSSCSSSSDTYATASSSPAPAEDYGIYDTITLSNFVAEAPAYADEEEAKMNNIFHDAQLITDEAGILEGDVEVYAVTGYDSDVEMLPQAELLVDRAAYESHFGAAAAAAAVDVEIEAEGVDGLVGCSEEVFARLLFDPEPVVLERQDEPQQQQAQGMQGIQKQEDEDEEESDGEGVVVVVMMSEEEDVSEEVTSDEDDEE
ncbi:hypothetical protein B0I35DRAFT_412484 [Stachybotrys elegans]|uniref:Uncharacterized protein n=1 Tax=Stachybotrys elegans TaxID=80388 RepID=A0A8K0SJT6_9HYPO|nr:hypothetical protein B0I35DRAFT_412484 [Stachybotrys elegans]